jgi:hypothetical protein
VKALKHPDVVRSWHTVWKPGLIMAILLAIILFPWPRAQ